MHTHTVVEIDPVKFADRVPTDPDTGEHIFGEADVLKFLGDQMNEAGVGIAMIYHDHEHAIEYQGRRDYFSMGLASLDAPAEAVIDGMAELSDLLNDHDRIESWTSYWGGKHHLHILQLPEPSTAIKESRRPPR